MKLQKTIIAIIALFIFASTGNAQLQYRRAADFDGDGKADMTTIRRNLGVGSQQHVWYTRRSLNGAMYAVPWGTSDANASNYDNPQYGDYDGDLKADHAVARIPAGLNGNIIWYIRNSQTGTVSYATFGVVGGTNYPGNFGGDLPLAADYDGDGRTDIAVVRRDGLTSQTPTTSFTWYWLGSQTGQLGYRRVSVNYLNACSPIHGDFDGDGKADFTQICRGNGTNGKMLWDIVTSSDGVRREIHWGNSGDYAALTPADFDGDGKSDLYISRSVPVQNSPDNNNYVWYIRRSSDGALQTAYFGGRYIVGGSFSFDSLIPNDYDGDNKADVAVVRDQEYGTNQQLLWYVQQSSNNQVTFTRWGLATDYYVEYLN